VQGKQKLIGFVRALKSMDPKFKMLWYLSAFFLLPQKESSKEKGEHSTMLPIALSGPRPHLSEPNAPHRC